MKTAKLPTNRRKRITVTLVLAACGGLSLAALDFAKLGAQAAQVRAQYQPARHAGQRGSWMLPGAESRNLLYVADPGNSNVAVFSYPGGALVGNLTGIGYVQGECVDAKGNVWIVDANGSTIVEYAHGGTTQIGSLDDSQNRPMGCAIDPGTGNLAVANYSTSSGPPSVLIFQGAQGSPTVYADSTFQNFEFCGYDADGNLFVDGKSFSGQFRLAELPKGSSTFTDITLNGGPVSPGGVQWDGTYLAVGDVGGLGSGETVIDRIAISGSGGTVAGSVKLAQSRNVYQFWIQAGKAPRIIGPNAGAVSVMYWRYPRGGNPTKTLTGSGISGGPFSAVVSKASRG